MPSPDWAIGMYSPGIAVARESHAGTAYPNRDAAWVLNIQSRWDESGRD